MMDTPIRNTRRIFFIMLIKPQKLRNHAGVFNRHRDEREAKKKVAALNPPMTVEAAT